MIVCKNCGKEFEGNFCPECGQKYEGVSITGCVTSEVTLPPDERIVTRGLAYERVKEDYSVTGFCECYDTDIVIPSFYNGRYVMYIGKGAFAGCEALRSVVIPDTVGTIGDSAFLGCVSLATVVMPFGLSDLGERAFFDCHSLASIVLPETLLYIGESAFKNCFRLKSVYFSGTPEDWNEINIEPFNDYLLSADLYYYSEEKPSRRGNFGTI